MHVVSLRPKDLAGVKTHLAQLGHFISRKTWYLRWLSIPLSWKSREQFWWVVVDNDNKKSVDIYSTHIWKWEERGTDVEDKWTKRESKRRVTFANTCSPPIVPNSTLNQFFSSVASSFEIFNPFHHPIYPYKGSRARTTNFSIIHFFQCTRHFYRPYTTLIAWPLS